MNRVDNYAGRPFICDCAYYRGSNPMIRLLIFLLFLQCNIATSHADEGLDLVGLARSYASGMYNPTPSSLQLPPGIGRQGGAHLLDFDPSKTAALLGSGWDSISSSVMGDCVKHIDVPIETILPTGQLNSDGQLVTYSSSLITNVSQVRSALKVSASASFSYGIYSGSGNFDLFSDDSVNTFSSYMYLSVTVLNASEVLSEKNLLDSRVKQISENTDDFRKGCGDQYVAGVSTGGTFTAVVRIETDSEAHQQSIDAAISGAAAGFGQASASMDSQFSSLQSMGRWTVVMVRKGDDGPLPELKDMNEYALHFAEKVSPRNGKPWVFSALTLSNATVQNLPTGITPYAYQAQTFYLDGLATLRDVGLQTRNDLLYAFAHPDQFDGLDKTKLQGQIDKVNSFMTAVLKEANDCATTPISKCNAPYPKLPDLEPPKRRPSPVLERIENAEAFYAKRGDPANVEAALAMIASIDESKATPAELYQSALLKAEVLDWKASFNGEAPVRYDTRILPVYREALGRAIGLGQALASKPCEADYLKVTLDALSGSPNDGNLVSVMTRMDALADRQTITSASCKTYLWDGVDRWRAWIKRLQADKATGAEKQTLMEDAAKLAEAAFNEQPDYFPNVYVWMSVHSDLSSACKILVDFANRSTPTAFLGLEPGFSEFKYSLSHETDTDFFHHCFVAQ